MRAFLAVFVVLTLYASAALAAPIDIASYVTAGGALSLSADDAYLSSEVTNNSAFTLDCNGKNLVVSGSGKINANANLEIRECVISWSTTVAWSGTYWPPNSWNDGFKPNKAFIKVNSGLLKLTGNTITATLNVAHPGPNKALYPPAAFLLDMQGGSAEITGNTGSAANVYSVGFLNGFNFDQIDLVSNVLGPYWHFPVRLHTGNAAHITDQVHRMNSFGGVYTLGVDVLNVTRPYFEYTGFGTSGDHFQIHGGTTVNIKGGTLFGSGCYGIQLRSSAAFPLGTVNIENTIIANSYTVALYAAGTSAHPIGELNVKWVEFFANASIALYSEHVADLTVEDSTFNQNPTHPNNGLQHLFGPGGAPQRWAYNKKITPWYAVTQADNNPPYVSYPFQ